MLALLSWPVVAAQQAAAPSTVLAPLVARYEAYVAGFPVVAFDFRLDEGGRGYALSGQVRTVGLLRLFYRLDLQTESQGTVGLGDLQPLFHEQTLRARGKDRKARLDYPGDGTVLTSLVPAEDPGRPKPTLQQIAHTLDPLTALLAMGHAVAQREQCEGRFAVFDGRRRYDIVLSDDGVERLAPSPAAEYAGEARRCAAVAVKIAGFSWDQDYSPHTNEGRVWFVMPRAGAPALPLRIDFGSSWGFITVRMTGLDPAP
ncbi:MAG TPA: DUF3108 domain-containing protein [Stellaceae bacterium]|nr:DUF3108 domain-containing protein [Stellaceae bacterium]